MYSEKHTIVSSLCDPHKRMRPSSFFLLFQDLATAAVETNGLGRSKMLDKGLLWIFLRVSVRFYDYPMYGDEVTLYTYPGQTKAVFYPRHAFMVNKDGKEMARVHSLWAVLKESDREMLMQSLPITGVEKHDDELPSPKKVGVPEDLSLVHERLISYSDLDLNKHMNNVRYVEYILDIFPSSFYKDHPLKGIDINYLHEIKEGETLSIYANKEKSIVVGKVGEKVAFTSELTF